MKEDAQSLMAALSVNLLTVNMLLSVFFLPGGSDPCNGNKPLLFITTPGKMEALSGSCLKIPCSFRANSALSSTGASGGWIKSDKNIYQLSDAVYVFPINISGNPKQGDCSSEFSGLNMSHSGLYYFRIESSPFKATDCSTSLQITVKDSPWSPTINTSAGLKDLKEKESVTISCSALTPCPHSPPELTWNLQQDSHNQTEKNTDGTLTTKIQENITLSDTHDGNIITCSVRYPVNEGNQFKTAETNVTLSVSYAPKDTSASISPSGLVSAGSWVNLSCSSRAKPPVSSFTWFKISSEGPVQVSEEQLYRVNVTEGGKFYCVAANDLGNQTSSWISLSFGGSPANPSDSVLQSTLIGVIIGIICLVVLVFCIRYWKRARVKNESVQELQTETSEDQVVQNASKETEEKDKEEDIHYGEIQISKETPDTHTSNTQGLETVYAEVNLSESAGHSSKTDDPTSRYAHVQK